MKRLKSFVFTRAKNLTAKWDRVFDGHSYQLEEGTDYQSVAAVQNTLYFRARKLGVKLHTQRITHGLVVKADRPQTPALG